MIDITPSSEQALKEEPVGPVKAVEPMSESTSRSSWWSVLSVKNVGAVYVWIAIIVLFTILKPHDFATYATWQSIVNQYSVTALACLSLVLPLAAGYFDLSIGYTMAFSGVLVAWLLQNTGMSPAECVVITLLASAAIGVVNATIVIAFGVDSFIGTLASGAIIASITLAISGGLTITGRVGGSFSELSVKQFGGYQLPVIYALVLMLAIGYLLERTKTGRYLYSTGFDQDTSRLSGVPVARLGAASLIASATIAGFTGMVLAARVSSADPNAGTSYLIPAFSAAFLGATQFRHGRFNPWGTVVAVLLLGTGDVGLLIAGGPEWTPQLFEGAVLIAAVALSSFGRSLVGERLARAALRRSGARAANTAAPPPSTTTA